VQLISVARRPEEALDLLSEYYGVERPRLRMGLPSGEKRALGCYVHRDKTIYISSQEYLYDPYVLIHEFYHHLRHVGGKHRGTERHARDFALAFLGTA
jgi:Zn-dependent peptidase ImmA (M78 family)